MKTANREQILEKSAEMFKHYGYRKTTMDDIAQAVGKGKSSIYYYYKSKEEIFVAVMEARAEELLQEVKTAVYKAATPTEKVQKFVTARMQVHKRIGDFFAHYLNADGSQLASIDQLTQAYEQREMDLLQNIFDEGNVTQDFGIQNTNLAAYTIVKALKSLEKPLYAENDERSMEATMLKLLDVLLYGIIKRNA